MTTTNEITDEELATWDQMALSEESGGYLFILRRAVPRLIAEVRRLRAPAVVATLDLPPPPPESPLPAHLGQLLSRCALPPAAGMDAVEARFVVVQDIPRRTELQFYGVRGEDRDRLSKYAVAVILRDHLPPTPPSSMRPVELLIEVMALRDELARLRPVYEAAVATVRGCDFEAKFRLSAAVDAARAENKEP